MSKYRPMPVFRTLCIAGLAFIFISYICNLVELMPGIIGIMFVLGAAMLIIGILGWIITGFGL